MPRLLLVVIALPLLAFGQLATALEATMATAKIDLPATHEGVDIFPGRDQPLELGTYQRRLKQYGIAVHAGQSILVTKLKVKEKSIELHLGGGGYGTFWDERETVSASTIYKSSRERSLESRLRSENDPGRRRSIESELRSARRDRERRNDRARAQAVVATEVRKERVAAKRLDAGSRFNIRFENEAAAQAATPELIRKLLADYLSLGGRGANSR